mmetsp:Transcript_53135/g.134793  ORF Transcript_53135/g.134793 Transcript_53135/m.134793 type:complete len:141 (-) Transcript_53135:7-429(-)
MRALAAPTTNPASKALTCPSNCMLGPVLAKALRSIEVGPAGVLQGVCDQPCFDQRISRGNVGLAQDDLEVITTKLAGAQLGLVPPGFPLDREAFSNAPHTKGTQGIRSAELRRQRVSRQRKRLRADGVPILEPSETDLVG